MRQVLLTECRRVQTGEEFGDVRNQPSPSSVVSPRSVSGRSKPLLVPAANGRSIAKPRVGARGQMVMPSPDPRTCKR